VHGKKARDPSRAAGFFFSDAAMHIFSASARPGTSFPEALIGSFQGPGLVR
jgi:hypothetical protein